MKGPERYIAKYNGTKPRSGKARVVYEFLEMDSKQRVADFFDWDDVEMQVK